MAGTTMSPIRTGEVPVSEFDAVSVPQHAHACGAGAPDIFLNFHVFAQICHSRGRSRLPTEMVCTKSPAKTDP